MMSSSQTPHFNAANQPDRDIFLTEQQLADRWQVSDKKLQADRWRGVGVPYVKIARAVRYRLSDIRAYEDKQSKGGRVG